MSIWVAMIQMQKQQVFDLLFLFTRGTFLYAIDRRILLQDQSLALP